MKKDMPVDLNGHFSNSKSLEYHKEQIRSTVSIYLDDEIMDDENISYMMAGSLNDCAYCGEHLSIGCNGNKIWVNNPCKYKDGLPPIEVELNVPSGVLVVGNDFRGGFKVVGDYDVNKFYGIFKTMKKYESIGLIHGFVGNTCPYIYRKKSSLFQKVLNFFGFAKIESTFMLGTNAWTEDYETEIHHKDWSEIDNISTDLWWYSIADKDEWIRRYGREPNTKNDDCIIIKCKPGVYKVTHQYHLIENEKVPSKFALIEWVSDPLPVDRDYKAEYDSMNISAGQIFHHLFRTNSNFYGNTEGTFLGNCGYAASVGKRIESLHPDAPTVFEWPVYHLTDCFFASIGCGFDWHHNGWACTCPDISINEPEIKIPVLNKPFYWYNTASSLFYSAKMDGMLKKMNPSFAELAFNMLQCIIRYGVLKATPSFQKAEISWERTEEAKQFLRELSEIYPVPDFCKDLL